MSRDEIDRVQQRTRRYWYEDGLTEIAAGCTDCLGWIRSLVLPAQHTALDGELRYG